MPTIDWVLRVAVSMVLLLFAGFPAAGQPTLFEEPLSPRIANYKIDVSYDAERRMLDGKEVLVWHNRTGEPVEELRFHLYLNAFRNSRSTFVEESGGQLRGDEIGEDGWGFSEVSKISLSSLEGRPESDFPSFEPGGMAGDWRASFPLNTAPVDLTEGMEFISPDDGNPDDKTVLRVPLPEPLPPGASIALDIDFLAQLPSPPFARTGMKEEYVFAGQWFPKIGVYEEGKGWNCHQFHAHSEFFADFGVYDVSITVPEDYVVGATGVEVEVKKEGDGTATHVYRAEDVHDFAWTGSPEFAVFTEKVQDVEIKALVQKERSGLGQRHLDAARVAVSYFQDHYGDYPFPNLTVVDPRRGALGSGGMEYPTLITAGSFYRLPAGLKMLELVIIHEFGHNYWYHLLASNEFEESWLDEGINTYTENRIIEETYGQDGNVIDLFGLKINDLQMMRTGYLGRPSADPITTNSWSFYDGSSYAVNSYSKPGLVLETLRHYLGAEKMRQVMRTYVERFRFKHPKTEDFLSVASEVAGEDLSWYFDQAIFSNAELDYAVTSLESKEIEDEGYDLTHSVDDPIVLGEEKSDDEDGEDETKLYKSEVKVRRLGEFRFPVTLEVVFEDGEIVRETWDGQDLWHKWTWTRPEKVRSATVDPDHQIPLDLDYLNNSRTREEETLGIKKVASRWLFAWQFVMDLLSP